MTTAPRSRAGRTTVSTCSARSAAYSSASARFESPAEEMSSRIERSRLPTGVAPGSRVTTTSWPLPRIQSASASTWVDLPAPSPPSRAMKKPVADAAWTGSPPRSASRRSRRSGTPPRSSAFVSTTTATGSIRAPISIRVKAAPPCAKTIPPPVSRCGPIAAARTGATTAPSATATRTTAWRCSVTRARRNSSVSWSSRVWPVLAATPAAVPASSERNSTVAVSGTSPVSSSANPVTAMARASSRRRDRAGSTLPAWPARMPAAVPPTSARTNSANVAGPPPRSKACSTATETAQDTAPATAAQVRTSSGMTPVRPLSGRSPALGARRPSSGERGRGVAAVGSTSGSSSETDAAKRPEATYDPSAAWFAANQSTPRPSALPTRVAASSAAAATGSAAKAVRRVSRRSASRWSGSGRTVAPSGGGAGSSAGAALSLASVHSRSAAPETKTVASSAVSAWAGIQSSHSGATTKSPRRTPSAPIIVQRRSSLPPEPRRPDSGPRRTAPKSRVARIRTPKTAATARAAPRYPPPKAPSVTAAWRASSTSTSSARASPMPLTSWALHRRRSLGVRSSARTARSRESAARASS